MKNTFIKEIVKEGNLKPEELARLKNNLARVYNKINNSELSSLGGSSEIDENIELLKKIGIDYSQLEEFKNEEVEQSNSDSVFKPYYNNIVEYLDSRAIMFENIIYSPKEEMIMIFYKENRSFKIFKAYNVTPKDILNSSKYKGTFNTDKMRNIFKTFSAISITYIFLFFACNSNGKIVITSIYIIIILFVMAEVIYEINKNNKNK